MMDQTVNVTFWVTGIVFVVVNLFMACAVIRYRHRKGKTEKAALRAGEQEARVVADDHHLGRHRRDARARPLRVGEVRHACRRTPPSSKWSASSGTGAIASPAATASSARSDIKLVTLDNPFGIDPEGSEGPGRRARRVARAAPADRQAREVAAAREGREPSVRRAAVPREDGHGARHGHVFLADADAHRRVRRAVRAAVRHGAFRDARPRRRRRRGGVPDMARAAADLRADAARRPRAMPQRARRCSRPARACHGAQAEGNKELERAEARGPGRLVSGAAAAELQARACAARTRTTPTASR